MRKRSDTKGNQKAHAIIRGSKHTMNDDGCQVEQHTRDLVRMFFELLPNHNTVEEDFRFRKSGGLHCLRANGPSIRGVCSSEVREHEVLLVIRSKPTLNRELINETYVVGAVGISVTVLLAE